MSNRTHHLASIVGPLWRPSMWVVVVGQLLAACGQDATAPPDPGPEPEPEPEAPADVNSFVASIGEWEDFAPPEESKNEPSPDALTVTIEEVVDNVTYVCTETPYSLTETPADIVMYEPNASIMWVGNLIQGDSYKNGTGSFEELSIRQRAPLSLSIDLLTGDNFAVVDNPSLTTVQSAIGDLIQRASDAGHRSGSNIHFESRLTYSVEQAALSLGLSARYLGGSAKAELSLQRNASQRTLTAHFVQTMFTISIELPQSPGDFFSDALTAELLQRQIDDGNIGKNNPPVYIVSITYGRTLTYTLTSTDTEDRMRAAISASFNGLVGGGGGYTEAELRETLSEQNIKVTAIGGEGINVLNLISEGNLKAYFTEDAALTSAKPLSYQLNFLGDNTIAKVAETSEYTLRECDVKVVSPGRFEFLALQESPAGIPVPFHVYAGDVNGDDLDDVIWNHVVSGSNQTVVGLGTASGTLDIQGAVTHPATPPEGWSDQYELFVGDFDGDGLEDLLWNRRQGSSANRMYFGFSNGDGTFEFADEVTHPTASWADGWRTYVGDVDADGDADLVWNYLSTSNLTWVGVSNGDRTFTFSDRFEHPNQGWSPYDAFLADVDGDRKADMVWNETSDSRNRVYVGQAMGSGSFEEFELLSTFQDNGGGAWGDYATNLGDIDGDGRIDFIWNAHPRDPVPIHRGLGLGSATFQFLGYQSVIRPENAGPLATYVGDFNGDGRIDMVWNDLSASANHIWVGLGNVDGAFDFTPVDQEHPATNNEGEDWTVFRGGVVVLDVNGDMRDDIVWNDRAVTNRIYVALAKEPGN